MKTQIFSISKKRRITIEFGWFGFKYMRIVSFLDNKTVVPFLALGLCRVSLHKYHLK